MPALPATPLSDTWPLEILNKVSFTEQDGKTTLAVSGAPINETEEEHASFEGAFEKMQQGFSGTYNQLDAYHAGIQSYSKRIKKRSVTKNIRFLTSLSIGVLPIGAEIIPVYLNWIIPA